LNPTPSREREKKLTLTLHCACVVLATYATLPHRSCAADSPTPTSPCTNPSGLVISLLGTQDALRQVKKGRPMTSWRTAGIGNVFCSLSTTFDSSLKPWQLVIGTTRFRAQIARTGSPRHWICGMPSWEHHCRSNWPYRIIPFPKMALKTIIGVSISLGEYVNYVGRN